MSSKVRYLDGLVQEKRNSSAIAIELRLTLTYRSGGRLNKKDGLTRYGNSHVKDKTS